MNRKTAGMLFTLVIFSLLILGFVFTSGILKNRKTGAVKSNQEVNVLGQQQENLSSPTSAIEDFVQNTVKNTLQNTVQNTFQTTKDTVSEKVTEVKSEIIKTVEKEISDLTQSQVKTLQWQICKDWGVVEASPTPKP